MVPYTVVVVESGTNYKVVVIPPNESRTYEAYINKKQWEEDDFYSSNFRVGINNIDDRRLVDLLIMKLNFIKRM